MKDKPCARADVCNRGYTGTPHVRKAEIGRGFEIGGTTADNKQQAVLSGTTWAKRPALRPNLARACMHAREKSLKNVASGSARRPRRGGRGEYARSANA